MNKSVIDQAVSILNHGGVVIFPTDTAFGIGCRIDKFDAINRVLKIKQKPANSALPILVSSISMAEKYFMALPLKIKNLMNNYWPGGLTIVYFANKNHVSETIRGENNTVGLRMPNHQDLLTIISKVGMPIVGTSANFNGQKTPYEFTDLDQNIVKQVDLILPGICETKQASTVMDCTQEPWQILRQGSVVI
jgi:L-threonylcarbamoyladenylate synthase